MQCSRCGTTYDDQDETLVDTIQSIEATGACLSCIKVENNRVTYYRQHQGDWLAIAKDSGLDVWLQQPGETQWEYTIWLAYRDSYPGKKPTYGNVAAQLGTSYGVVSKVSQRWSFQVRMQYWMKYCDDITMLQRRKEILSMNAKHIELAEAIHAKIAAAINHVTPETLSPGEIVAMGKYAAELERKARIDTIAQEDMRRDVLTAEDTGEVKKSPTKQSDLSEIMQILMKAGVMKAGIKETKTTEVIINNDNEENVGYIQE
jgi:hypothetical protein